MITKKSVQISAIVILAIAALHTRVTEATQDRERGDENITKVLYAALAVTLGALIIAAITAAVNGKLPLIGGDE